MTLKHEAPNSSRSCPCGSCATPRIYYSRGRAGLAHNILWSGLVFVVSCGVVLFLSSGLAQNITWSGFVLSSCYDTPNNDHQRLSDKRVSS
mmetsp:Transcript_29475/g.61506  ORF Transcript_29475/g.61506 Transcript_29475/m.61506 type:complete len:91 (-) Transcript_29475:1706-1978(-)